jgi:TonB-like protein
MGFWDPGAPAQADTACRSAPSPVGRLSLRWIEIVLRWAGWAWLFAGFMTGAMAADSAALEPSNGQRSFDIPAQDLSTALSDYSATTGIGVLVDGSLSAGRMSAPIKGAFNPTAALQALLDKTGLTARYVTPTAFTLAPASAEPRPGAGADLARESYFAAVQAAVVRVLCKRAGTRPGRYRSVVRLWIDRSGVVQRSEILASSGQADRDAAIEAQLADLDIEERPAFDLPQPVTLVLLPRNPQKSVDCPAPDGGLQR